MAKLPKLSPRQQIFSDEYLIDLNITQAAIRAGFSPKTAAQQGSRLLKSVKVRTYVDIKMAERSRRTGITQDRVLQELARVGFVNVADLVDPDTAQVRDGATKDDLAVIQGVKVKRSWTEGGSSVEREIKVADKNKALELMGRHLGMFNDKLDVNASQKVVIVDDIDDANDD